MPAYKQLLDMKAYPRKCRLQPQGDLQLRR